MEKKVHGLKKEQFELKVFGLRILLSVPDPSLPLFC